MAWTPGDEGRDDENSEEMRGAVRIATDMRHLPARRGKNQGRGGATRNLGPNRPPFPRPALRAAGRAPARRGPDAEPSKIRASGAQSTPGRDLVFSTYILTPPLDSGQRDASSTGARLAV